MHKYLVDIQTERLILRGINETDTLDIVKWRSDPNVYKFFKSPHKISIEEHKRWYNNYYLSNLNRYDWICIEKDTLKKIGVFGIIHNKKVVEVNYLLAPEAQRKGYAGEALQALVKYASETLEADQIVAEIHKDNVSSIGLIEKLGFEKIASEESFLIFGFEV